MRLKNTFAKLSGVASGLLLSGLLALNGVEARLVSDDNGTSVDVPGTHQPHRRYEYSAAGLRRHHVFGRRLAHCRHASGQYVSGEIWTFGELHPEVLQADTHFIQGANLNLESLMALKPDLVLINASDRRMLDRVRAAGLTAFGISAVKWHYDVEATYEGWMRSLKALFPDAKPILRRWPKNSGTTAPSSLNGRPTFQTLSAVPFSSLSARMLVSWWCQVKNSSANTGPKRSALKMPLMSLKPKTPMPSSRWKAFMHGIQTLCFSLTSRRSSPMI